ncbi:MAG: hypothetical protein U1E15_13150 [Hyphomicrobiales bacterium]
MKRIVLAFALISTPVCAEDLPAGLEDLSIEGVGYQGRKALEQFYGRPLTVSEGRWKGVFHLSPGGQVDWEKPSGGTLHGHFGDGPQHPAMCLDFSYDDSACFDVQQVKSALKFESEGGKSFMATAPEGEAEQALPDPEEAFCGPLAQFLKAGRADAFDSLVDETREAVQFNPLLAPSYWTTVQFGQDACRYDTNGLGPGITCDFVFSDDAPEAEILFEKVVGLAQSCDPRAVESADIDMQTWLRYGEIDFVRKKTRKIPQERYHPAKDDSLRRATIHFAGGVDLQADVSYRSICTSAVACKYYYGTWLWFEHRK